MPAPRKLLILASILVSVALLYPGVTQPVLTLQGSIPKADLTQLGIAMLAGDESDGQGRQMLSALAALMGLDRIEGEVLVYDTTRSIWQTAEDLAASKNLLVAMLIVLFSVVIPSLKLLLQAAALVVSSHTLLAVNGALSKWSMADVFAMALLVAYLAGSASGELGGKLTMTAQLEPGFFYFLGYCLFSIAAGTLLMPRQGRQPPSSPP